MAYLDHIGIAISENSRLAKLLELLDLPVSSSEKVEREKLSIDWVPLPQAKTNIELLRPLEKDGEIERFLEKNKRRDGVHHLSFFVKNLDRVTDSLKKEGFPLVYEKHKKGASGRLINFVHPKSTGGVLIEISQNA